jgi:beta-phosphoglucomutase
MIKAVVFDFDGVIIKESMKYQAKAFQKAFEAKGLKITEKDVLCREGAGARRLIAEVLDKPQDDPLVEELYDKKQEVFKQISQDLHANPLVLKIVKKLKKQGLKLGLATGTHKSNLEDRLGKNLELFESVVDATSVKKTKPDPEPYLKSAKNLGVKPSECLVIENAPRGIQAAKKAGMKCIAIQTTLPTEFLEQADWIVKDYPGLEQKIQEVLESQGV